MGGFQSDNTTGSAWVSNQGQRAPLFGPKLESDFLAGNYSKASKRQQRAERARNRRRARTSPKARNTFQSARPTPSGYGSSPNIITDISDAGQSVIDNVGTLFRNITSDDFKIQDGNFYVRGQKVSGKDAWNYLNSTGTGGSSATIQPRPATPAPAPKPAQPQPAAPQAPTSQSTGPQPVPAPPPPVPIPPLPELKPRSPFLGPMPERSHKVSINQPAGKTTSPATRKARKPAPKRPAQPKREPKKQPGHLGFLGRIFNLIIFFVILALIFNIDLEMVIENFPRWIENAKDAIEQFIDEVSAGTS